MSQKSRRFPVDGGVLSVNGGSGLAIWNEMQIHQENWGGTLGLPARESGAVVELASTEGRIVVPTDPEQRNVFKECILSLSGLRGIRASADFEVKWRRPVDIFTPFRPLVHRNTTPFLDPYDIDHVLRGEAPVMPTPSKKSDAKISVATTPLHVQFPEIVDMTNSAPSDAPVIDSFVFTDGEAVAQYRQVQPLTQAYDVSLELGCAATPVEACGSQYSTALRHRLNQAEAISQLSEPPPFVMDAFNTAIRFIENAQHALAKGNYLWELIYPHAPGTCHPVYNPYGKYIVRLFIDGFFRQVTIDDYLPVDALGRPFFSVTNKKEIWPALIAKALFVALGPSRRLLFTDSEAIIACLLGEWVPQRISPRSQPATACAMLLNARREYLCNESDTTHFSASRVFTPDKERGTTECSPEPCGPSPRKSTISNEKPISQGNVAAGSVTPAKNNAQSVLSGNVSAVTGPPVPEAPIICAVGNLSYDMRKLYVIHEIVVFRNTLALRISTNPPSTIIEPRELTLDSKDEAVQDLLCHPPSRDLRWRGNGWLPSQGSVSTEFSFWVTFEELTESLDLIIWRQLGQESPFTFNSRITYADAPGQQKKKGAASVAAAAANAGRQTVVRWMHISCKNSEQIAIVNLGGGASCAVPLCVSPTQSTSALAHQTPAPSMVESETSHTRTTWGDGKEVHLDLYRWDRGDVLCRAASFTYEPSKLECLIHSVPPGSHVFRVTVTGIEPQEVICFFSTHNFILGDEKDALRSANIFKMSDAGPHPGVERCEEEVIWFKHRFMVKEATTVSFVLSTLECGEDVTMYRDMPGVSGKDSKAVKVRSTNYRPQAKELMEGTPRRGRHAEIIPYCHVLLMDLDTGVSRRGAVGHLVRQRIEPNVKGFLVMAYALVDAESLIFLLKPEDFSMDAMECSSTRDRDPIGASQCCDRALQSAHGTTAPLFPRGWWRLVVLSSVALDSYKPLLKDTCSFAEKGQLRQGSNGILFSYSCTVSDRTDFTILLDVESQRSIPFYVKIYRSGYEGPPLFVSDVSVGHLFVPHVTVEIPEKVKNVSYIVEAWLDKDKVDEWELMRRASQEAKYLVARTDAEVRAEAKQQKELQEYHEDPRAFRERLANQDVGATENVVPSPSREQLSTASRKRRPSIDRRRVMSNVPSGRQGPTRNSTAPFPLANPVTLQIDTIDHELVVSYDLRLYFSAKTDVKCVAPGRDPLSILRGLWVPPIDHQLGDGAPLSGGRSGGQRGKQKDMSPTPEELYKADQGRLSRQNFLENPKNLLFPHLAQSDKARAGEESAVSPLAPAPPMSLIVEVEDEPNFSHAPILDESAYCIQRCSLYATEVAPPTLLSPALSVSGVPPLRTRSPNGRLAVPNPGGAPPLTDDDALVAELKAPINELGQWLGEELRREDERRMMCRSGMKAVMCEYWESRKPGATLLALPHSKEDDGGKRPRTRSKIPS